MRQGPYADCCRWIGQVWEKTYECNAPAFDYGSEVKLCMEEIVARLLRKVPGLSGDERRGGDHHEERSPRNSGRLPGPWYQYVSASESPANSSPVQSKRAPTEPAGRTLYVRALGTLFGSSGIAGYNLVARVQSPEGPLQSSRGYTDLIQEQ